MTIKVYQGERPSHTHENRMLDAFIEAVRPRWERSEDSLVLISNAYWNQAEIDLVCILAQALVVIDFKAYSGKIEVSENGPWRKGSVPIAGGRKTNPLVQVKDNKFAVMDWLRSHDLLKHCNLGHISGAVCFEGQVEIEGALPPKVAKWFSVISVDHAATYLQALASPEVTIPNSDADRIVAALSVPEYLWAPHQIVDIASTEEDRDSGFSPNSPATGSQQSALYAIQRFLAEEEFQILTVSGMISTGKSDLIPRLKQLNLESRSIVLLAPNRRLAYRLASRCSLSASSIYHHIYETNANPKSTKGDKGVIEVLPIKNDNQDREDCIYVIDDAHLVTDTYFEPEPGKRFGSGRLVSDLLEYAKLNGTKRKIILLSDPYHVTQARESDQFSSPECWARYNITGQSITLNQLIRSESSGAILDNARQLVHCIDEAKFTVFDLILGNGLEVMTGQEAAAYASELIRSAPDRILLLAYSNREVSSLNSWARRQHLGQRAPGYAVTGDLLEIYSFVDGANPLECHGQVPTLGDLVIVASTCTIECHQQKLRGRDRHIEFRVQEVTLVGTNQPLLLLIDFLISETKEIDADIQRAVQVWSKANDVPPPIKARFGYAATAHHARGFRRPSAVVALPKEAGIHNEAYFRWLYTAITRADETSVIANWAPLHPFDKATFSRQGALQKSSIALEVGLKFDPQRPLSPGEEALRPPDGLAESQNLKETVLVWLLFLPIFDAMGLQLRGIQGHPYQVHFTVQTVAGDISDLQVSYNGKHMISAIKSKDEELLLGIAESAVRRIQLNTDQRQIVSFLSKLSGLRDVRILSLRPTSYRVTLVLGLGSDGLAELELNHDGGGMVTSARTLQFTDEKIVERLAAALEAPD